MMSFVEQNKDYIKWILLNEGADYCKAKILLNYIKYNNITYNKKYILDNGINILNNLIQEYISTSLEFNETYKYFSNKIDNIKINDTVIKEMNRILSV